MANLMKPISRCLNALKQTNGVASLMQMRLASSSKPPFQPPAEGSINKPIEKQSFDETADPKESCKYDLNLVFIFI